MQKVRVDKEKCIGCGLCASIAEKAFKLNDEGKAEVLEVKETDKEKIQEAIDSCAVGAIVWVAEKKQK